MAKKKACLLLSLSQVQTMVKTMVSAFKDNLPTLKWMSEGSRQSASAKLDHMVQLVGYPDSILNDTFLDEMYEGVEVKRDTYLLNTVAYSQFDRQRQLRLYFDVYDRYDGTYTTYKVINIWPLTAADSYFFKTFHSFVNCTEL